MAAFSATLFLVRWRGALHAIDYENRRRKSAFAAVPSLGELCSEILVADSSFMKLFIPYLPSQLHSKLMGTAVLKSLDRSVEALLMTWPGPILCLRELCSHLYNTLEVVYDNNLHNSRMRQGIHITNSLISAFLNFIQSNDKTSPLRILDLRELPTIDMAVHHLTNEIIALHQKSCKVNNKSAPYGITGEARSQDDGYKIYIDCSVRDEDTYQELCSALELCRNANPLIRLHVSKIDASCLGESHICMLLEALNANELTGLCIQYNSLCNAGLLRLMPELARFRSLAAIDVSCNNLNFLHVPATCALFAEMLGAMPQLRRLDLSNNRLTNCVNDLLGQLADSGLEYLKLSACVLSRNDLDYLARANFVPSLLELDLSENIALSQHLSQLVTLLSCVAPCLQILEIEDCKFGNAQLEALVLSFTRMKQLRYLNFARQPLLSSIACVHIPQLAALPNLECVRLSYTEDCYVDDLNALTYDQRKTSLREQMEKVASTYGQRASPAERGLRFVWTESMSLL